MFRLFRLKTYSIHAEKLRRTAILPTGEEQNRDRLPYTPPGYDHPFAKLQGPT